MARPSRKRAKISMVGEVARPHSTEPTTNRMAPSISDFLRPSLADSEPAPRAPRAAPAIMLETIHSIT